MKNLIKAGRAFYGIGIAGIGIQQFIYGEFRPVILPDWPASFSGVAVWAYISGICLVVAAAIIIFSKKAKTTTLDLGLAFLLLFIGVQIPYQLFISPNDFHIGAWTDPLKELALSGGAFVIADSYNEEGLNPTRDSAFEKFMKLFIPWGSIFFSITMIVFGIDHFIYTPFVATLVPNWIPWHIFWTYFAGIALAGAGVCIILKIKLRLIGILLGIMLFIWFVILHIPRAIMDPYVDKGNEVTSVFEALAFSGIAFVIAFMRKRKLLA